MRNEMKYWLMAYVTHASDFPFWLQSSEWNIYLDSFEDKLKEGDVVYIANTEIGIYAWGTVWEKEQSRTNGQDFIKIGRGAIKLSLIDNNQIQQKKELSGLLSFPSGRFTFLTNKQVRILNNLMPYGVSKPPQPRRKQFIINQLMEEDEGLHTEYKEVSINNVPNEAYELAVAYLNQEGGSIYFGIRDNDKAVVGITATNAQRDEIKKKIENKLSMANPSILPVTNYTMDFHKVIDELGNEIPDVYVFELEVKPSSVKGYKTTGGKNYLKTFSGRRKIR